METIRRDLEREVMGKRVKSIEILNERTARRRSNPHDLETLLPGQRLSGVRRRGKYLLFDLDSQMILVVHLGMTGQLLHVKGTREPVAEHTRAIITLAQGGQLRFVDQRTFGELFIAESCGKGGIPAELSHLGFDPLANEITWAGFATMLASRDTRLKALLVDQSFVAGIGNIYSDEILFASGLRYDRRAGSISAQEARRLYRAMIELLNEAVAQRGSSLADEAYRDLYGETGNYQGQHNVYDREGKPCPRCKHPIARDKVNGRSTFYCPHCQL